MTETTILDESAVSEIEDRANAATREPWHQSALAGMYIVADGTDFATIASVGEYNADGSIHLLFADAEANLEFIVHAREDIPALCATVKHLRAEVERLKKPRMFPIQDGAPAVRWELAQKAYTTYADLFGTSQSLQRLAERGGFGREEFSCLYLGHDPRCKHSDKCVAEVESQIGYVAELQSQLEQLRAENETLQAADYSALTSDVDSFRSRAIQLCKELAEYAAQVLAEQSDNPQRDICNYDDYRKGQIQAAKELREQLEKL